MDKNNHTLTPKKWQQEALDAWVKGLCKGTIKAPTGTGKSYLAILGHHHLNNPLTLIITPTIILKEQWEKDLKESGINADVMVINGVRDNPQILTKYLFIVLDEIHHYASDQSQTIFKYMYHHFIMGLSATPERKDEQHEIFLEHAPIVYTYHITDAIEHYVKAGKCSYDIVKGFWSDAGTFESLFNSSEFMRSKEEGAGNNKVAENIRGFQEDLDILKQKLERMIN